MTRRLARHPLGYSEGKEMEYGVPGAAKNTGDGAWLNAIACLLKPKFTSRKPTRIEQRH